MGDGAFMNMSPLLVVPDTGSARRNVLPKNELPGDANIGDRVTEQVLASLPPRKPRCARAPCTQD